MSVWAAVPVRSLWGSKRRLAPLLTPSERAALSACLLRGVLRALQAVPEIARIVVVSPDPAARALAAAHGAATLCDPPAPCTAEGTLNAAVDAVGQQAAARGAQGLLVLPADLPLLRPSDVAAVLAAPPPPPGLVLVPTADGGTGALFRTPADALPACFGPASAERHLAAAAARHVRARVLWRARLARDCDAPADLLALATAPVSAELRALLLAWAVETRAAIGGVP